MILKQERYNEEGDVEAIARYDETIREYYATRTGGGTVSVGPNKLLCCVVRKIAPTHA